jgi:hypothetical protein
MASLERLTSITDRLLDGHRPTRAAVRWIRGRG